MSSNNENSISATRKRIKEEIKQEAKRRKKARKASEKALKKLANNSTKDIRGAKYYKKLIKSGSLYKRINFSFSLMFLLSFFVALLLLFAVTTLYFSGQSKRDFKDRVNLIRVNITQLTEQLSDTSSIIKTCVDPVLYETIDISVKVQSQQNFSSNNPYFDRIKDNALNPKGFENLSSDEIKTAFFTYNGNKYIYTQVKIELGQQAITLSAFKNIELNNSYTIFFMIAVVVIFIIINIIIIFTNRAIAISVLMPLQTIADEVKSITEENLAMKIDTISDGDVQSGSVDNLTNALNEMLQRLNIAFTQQQYFVSNVSHELRIPLTIMKGYIDILLSWGKGDEKITDESLNAISEEIDNMRNIVERLLMLQTIETGSYDITFTTCDLNEIAQKAATTAKMMTSNHEIVTSLAPKVMNVNIDEDLMDNILRALIDNSVKYTPKGGKISFITETVNGKYCIIIEDTGIGIPQNECEKVKERFYRTDTSRDKRIGGNGLGLSLANSSVLAMGGSLDIYSDLGEGTKVVVALDKAR